MAACASFHHIFENPLPETPTLLESLSPWHQIKTLSPVDHSSFTEIFGELHFLQSSSSSSSSSHDKKIRESLQLCTEGLGSESSDDVEDLIGSTEKKSWQNHYSDEEKEKPKSLTSGNNKKQLFLRGENYVNHRRSRSDINGGHEFPPPITCIGKSGKPSVTFQSYRKDGRFILKEIRIPTREFLHARREDGRLKLHFLQLNEDIQEEEDEEEEEEEEEEEVEEEEDEEEEDN